jgi:Rieske Fe-S protein
MDSSTKKKASAGGAVALIAAVTGLYTAVHGTHTTTTAVSRNDTPVVINRPHDVNGSPLPVTVVPNKGGPPIVIVGAEPPACFYGGTQDKPLPDKKCTPGVADVTITKSDICPHLGSNVIRSVSAATKKKVREEYGYDDTFKGEIDHLISLELGGSNDIKNLWPQEGKIPNGKDAIENRLHGEVCAGTISLVAAQREIAANWTTAK